MLELNFSPFPELKTERLLLRKLTKEDGEQIFFLRSNEQVMQYIDREKTKSIEEAENFIQLVNNNVDTNTSVFWAITMNSDPSFVIGTICFWRFQLEHYRAEVGYVLNPGYWHKGIMREALLAVSDYGFTGMGLHSIEAHINPENIASGKVLENSGYVREAYFKESYYCRGQFVDTAIYSLLKR